MSAATAATAADPPSPSPPGAATFALGTDTGGSIRVPSALNGVVGLKPAYGLVPRHGVTSLSWSLDHVGSITRTVEDAALVLTALAATTPATQPPWPPPSRTTGRARVRI